MGNELKDVFNRVQRRGKYLSDDHVKRDIVTWRNICNAGHNCLEKPS